MTTSLKTLLVAVLLSTPVLAKSVKVSDGVDDRHTAMGTGLSIEFQEAAELDGIVVYVWHYSFNPEVHTSVGNCKTHKTTPFKGSIKNSTEWSKPVHGSSEDVMLTYLCK